MKKLVSIIIAILTAFLPVAFSIISFAEQNTDQVFSVEDISPVRASSYDGVQFTSSCTDESGSYIILGGISKDVAGHGFVNSMGIIKKVREDGTEIWTDYIGGNEKTDISDISLLPDGSIIAVGYTVASKFYDLIDEEKTTVNSFIIKYDAEGNRKWIKLLDGTGGNTVYTVASSDNCFYIGGYSKSKDGVFSNFEGDTKAFVFKYSTDGNYISGYTLSCSKANSVKDICVNNDGKVFAIFQTTSNTGSYSEIPGIKDDVISSVIVRFTESLEAEWLRGVSDSFAIDLNSITYANDGGCVVSGRCRITGKKNTTVLKDVSFAGNPGTDEGIIVRINSDSSIGIITPISGNGNDYVTGICRIADGTKFAICGYSDSVDYDFDFYEDNYDGSEFGFLFIIDSMIEIEEEQKTIINGSLVDMPKTISSTDFSSADKDTIMLSGTEALPITKKIYVSGSTSSTDGIFVNNISDDESPFICSFYYRVYSGNSDTFQEYISGTHTHSYTLLKEDNSDCTNRTRTYICNCGSGYMESVGEGHTLEEEIITQPGCTTYGLKKIYCTVCSYEATEKINPINHLMTDWETIDEPGKFNYGKRQRECCRCIYKETETLPFTATELLISETEMTLDYKKSATLTTDADTVKWSSSNPKAVKVSDSGEITAVGKGDADITAKNETTELTAVCHVTVHMTFWQRIIWAIKSFFGLV